jgi:outer membrane lipoprotein SlyB
MKFLNYIFIFIFTFIFITSCSSHGVNRDDQNSIIQEFYAEVSFITEVQLSSNVKTGIVGGGILGALEESDGDSEDIISGAIVGAIFGGLFTSLSEGGNQAFEYHLYSPEQGEFTLIQKEKVDISSGCLLVRVSNTTNVFADDLGRCKTN